MKSSGLFLSFLAFIGLSHSIEAQTVSIIFKVNMSHQVELGNFDPNSDFVDIAGTFNGWGTTYQVRLNDSDNDQIYDITLGGFTPLASVEYKFRINGDWATSEFPGGGPNRVYIVQTENNVITVWYDNEVSNTGPPVADFTANSRTLLENGMVYFEDLSSGAVEHWSWTFEGGSPAQSEQQDPIVVYSSTGDFDVSLIVSNDSISDTLILADFMRSETEYHGFTRG